MSTRQVLGGIGAAIGGFFFGPAGAQWGWAIGSAVGGAVDPQVIKGPSVGDIAAQTSQEGTPRPIVFALSQPMAGNIIASGEPRIVKKKKRQGKGGPKVETESVFRTYAIGVCEGPITRFVRVWRNNQLVYDADNAAMGATSSVDFLGVNFPIGSDNAKFLAKARFFLGDFDQLPSPDLEHIFGVGTTPAHRGTAYMVVADEDLTDLRGAIPQYVFQVERCEGVYLTSRVYPIEAIEALAISGGLEPADHPLTVEAVDSSGALVSGILGAALEIYDDALPEALDIDGEVVEGELREALITYDDAAPEALDITAEVVEGELREALITYEDADPEALDIGGSIISGDLS